MHNHSAVEIPLSDSTSEEEVYVGGRKDEGTDSWQKHPSTPRLEDVRSTAGANQTNNDLEKVPTALSRHHGHSVSQAVTAQDWTGPDDPENPQNWSLLKRAYHSVPPAMSAFVTTFGTSVYTPAVSSVMETFGVSRTVAILPLTVYTLGLAFGPMISAPISETYGRRIVYLTTLPLSMLFTLGAGFSKTLASLLVCRFFAGMAGSAALAVGAGTNADIWPPKTRAISSSLFITSPFLGPSIGPVVGGFLAQYKDWRWTQWTILFFGVLALAIALPMKETYKRTILTRRAKRLDIAGPPAFIPPGIQGFKVIFTVTVVRPLHMMILEPIVALMGVYSAFTFAVMFSFFAAFPVIFQQTYDFTVSQVGLAFLGMGLGSVLACTTCIVFDRVFYLRHHARAAAEGKHAAPEHRLYAAILGSVVIPISLFWLGWTARKDVHWISPIFASVIFGWGNLSIFISTALYTVDVYGPLNGASAVAANGIARYSAGSVFPLFIIQMYVKLGTGWATSLLGFVSVAMMPIPWLFFRYGPRIRAKSKYDTVQF